MNDYSLMTASGRVVDLRMPEACSIDAIDIAYALARIPRFGGWLRKRYSVARHSVLVTTLAKSLLGDHYFDLVDGLVSAEYQSADCPRKDVFLAHCLLHDAHEAFIGDLSRPLQKAMAFLHGDRAFTTLRNRWDEQIHAAARIPLLGEVGVQMLAILDDWALALEANALMPHGCLAMSEKFQRLAELSPWEATAILEGASSDQDDEELFLTSLNKLRVDSIKSWVRQCQQRFAMMVLKPEV